MSGMPHQRAHSNVCAGSTAARKRCAVPASRTGSAAVKPRSVNAYGRGHGSSGLTRPGAKAHRCRRRRRASRSRSYAASAASRPAAGARPARRVTADSGRGGGPGDAFRGRTGVPRRQAAAPVPRRGAHPPGGQPGPPRRARLRAAGRVRRGPPRRTGYLRRRDPGGDRRGHPLAPLRGRADGHRALAELPLVDHYCHASPPATSALPRWSPRSARAELHRWDLSVGPRRRPPGHRLSQRRTAHPGAARPGGERSAGMAARLHMPIAPSIRSRSRSAWPLWRA
jgi:hypothetical protein